MHHIRTSATEKSRFLYEEEAIYSLTRALTPASPCGWFVGLGYFLMMVNKTCIPHFSNRVKYGRIEAPICRDDLMLGGLRSCPFVIGHPGGLPL